MIPPFFLFGAVRPTSHLSLSLSLDLSRSLYVSLANWSANGRRPGHRFSLKLVIKNNRNIHIKINIENLHKINRNLP